jgi:hypothetical protein
MSEQVKEQPKVENQQSSEKIPLGFVAKDDTNPVISFQDFFDVMRLTETLSNLVFKLKQENFEKGAMKYYFEEDLVDVVDKDGNPVYVKKQDGNIASDKEGKPLVQKRLKDTFWS